MSSNDSRDCTTEELTSQGFRCLEVQDYSGALEVAAQLEDRRYTAAFEIGALAHAGQDQLEQAVELLERGVEAAPDVWLLWQLLGNYRSDLDRFDDATQAYEHALQCTDVSKPSVYLNQAILFGRLGQYKQALALLDQAETQADSDSVRAQVEASRGWMHWKSGTPKEVVVEKAIADLDRFADGREFFQLIRNVNAVTSSSQHSVPSLAWRESAGMP